MQANEEDTSVDYLTQVAEFAAQTPAEALPRTVRDKTALILADSIGAMAGGAVEPDVVALRDRPNLGSDGPALLIGTRRHVARANAALLNGTAGTTLEMDEGNQFAKGHPGIHTVPAALAAVADIGRPVSWGTRSVRVSASPQDCELACTLTAFGGRSVPASRFCD